MKKREIKELEVFEYIKSRLDEGISPSVREIQLAMGFKSTSTAHRYIESLIESGRIEKMDNLNRSLRLPNSKSISIPVIGTVTAGIPITAIEDITGYISFEADKHYSNPLFALKVRGESMINAGILDGDIVIVEQTPFSSFSLAVSSATCAFTEAATSLPLIIFAILFFLRFFCFLCTDVIRIFVFLYFIS